MSDFRFTVTDTWENTALGVYHVVGILEQGTILPDTEAIVEGGEDLVVLIQSVALVHYTGAKPHPNEFTLSVTKPRFDLPVLKGKVLRSAAKGRVTMP
jgi:hypothetical protein